MRLLILWLVVTSISGLLGLAAYSAARALGFDDQIAVPVAIWAAASATFFIAMWGARVSHRRGTPGAFLGR